MARTGQAGRRDGPDESRSFVLRVAGGRHLRGPGLPYVTTLTSHKEPSPGRLEEPLPRENPCSARGSVATFTYVASARGSTEPRWQFGEKLVSGLKTAGSRRISL